MIQPCHAGGYNIRGNDGSCVCSRDDCGCNLNGVCACPDCSGIRCSCTKTSVFDEGTTVTLKFKAGDKVRGRADSNYTPQERVLRYYGPSWVVYTLDDQEHSVDRRSFDNAFELIPDFFEAGKTYKYSSARFECLHIEEDSRGPVAVGKVEWGGDSVKYMELRRQFTPNWTEV